MESSSVMVRHCAPDRPWPLSCGLAPSFREGELGAMIDWLNDTRLLGNPIEAWLLAAAAAVAGFLLVHGGARLVAARLRARQARDPRNGRAVLLALLAATRSWLVLALAVLLAASLLDFTPRVDTLLGNAIVIVSGLQVALWANGLIELWQANATRPGEARVNPVMATILGWIGQTLVWSTLLMFVLANVGVNVTAFVASLGVGGVAVALAMQQVLSDLFASAAIGLDKPFEVGQFIAFGNDLGTVDYVGIKTTRIRSLSGEQLIISNTNLLNQLIRNYGRMNERRVVFGFRVPYGTPRERIEAIPPRVRTIIESQQQVRFDRGHLAAFGEFGLEFEFVYYVLNSDFTFYRDVQQRINLGIMALLEEHDVAFAVPVREVRLVSDAAAPAARDAGRGPEAAARPA
jgi:small-conductance mechanosensitive channel